MITCVLCGEQYRIGKKHGPFVCVDVVEDAYDQWEFEQANREYQEEEQDGTRKWLSAINPRNWIPKQRD